MRLVLRKSLTLLTVLLSVLVLSPVRAETVSLQLLGRSKVSGYEVVLSEADWAWLHKKGTLRLGISVPDYPPFDITNSERFYEGITADYAGLLAELLHVRIEIQSFDSRVKAIEALQAGELDVLGTSNGFEAANPQLLMSAVYAEDQPTLVTRSDDLKTPPDLAGTKVAMLSDYLPIEKVRSFYPAAAVHLYPSTLSAIGAVAYGKADVFLGDAISTNFLVGRHYWNTVRLAGYSAMEGGGFSFALSRENNRLHQIINSALAVIPSTERLVILRRWGAAQINLPGQHLLQFTPREKRWLDAHHHHVKVSVADGYMPISFFDAKGEYRGISADVLARISLRTGIKFDVVRSTSQDHQVRQILDGDADIVSAINPNRAHEEELNFTRPYFMTPFVLVSRSKAGGPRTLGEMAGKKLALVRGHVLESYISVQFPLIDIVYVENAAQALKVLDTGEVDGAINSLFSTRYMISARYHNRLQVTSTVGDIPLPISLATNRGALELYSILDKALLSISPEEMEDLVSRWQSEVVIDESYWSRNRLVIIQGFAIAGVLLLIAFVWIAYLRKLIRSREEAQVALKNQLEFMLILIDATPHPIYVRDREGRMKICNTSYLEVFGLSREAAMDRLITVDLFGDPAEALAYHSEYLKVMEQGVPVIQDRTLTLADGRELIIYHWMLPYCDSDGVVIGMIAGWIDVSERQRLLTQLQEANSMAEEAKRIADDASRAKTIFLATMSHEIRTPMNAITGMLELALKKADQGLLDRLALEVASGAAHDLLDLIGDILDVARIESGKLSLTPKRAKFRELIDSPIRIFENLAREKHLSLMLEFDQNADRDVLIDPLRFKQIISNLLSNAIKFTSEGEVRLTVNVLPASGQGRLSIRIQVEDTGIGISVADQSSLFSPFSQASNNTQSTRTGSGLGLVISRTLCEMMGGELYLSSVLGQGTRVEVRLNLVVLEPAEKLPKLVTKNDGKVRMLNVLVVDDYSANRLLLSQQLAYLGHRVFDAEDGDHGLRVWRSNDFDVVITDCNMPIMDGYSLAQAIRLEELKRGRLRCVILGFTANAQIEEKDRCIKAGMNDCLFKPISLKILADCLGAIHVAELPDETETLTTLGTLDINHLRQFSRGDEATIKSLLKDLSECNSRDLNTLRELHMEKNVQGLAELAHKIKGGARIVRAHDLILACEQLELACSAAESASPAMGKAIESLSREMLALRRDLELLCAQKD